MGTTLNLHAYQRLIDENLAWLDRQPRTLEREHIKDIVRLSPIREYYIYDRLAEMQHCETGMCTHCVDLLCDAVDTLRPARVSRESKMPPPTRIQHDIELAEALKDKYRVAGTIAENMNRLIDNVFVIGNDRPELAKQKLIFTLVLLALFETQGVPATARILDADIMEQTINDLSEELGTGADFKLNLKEPLSSSKEQ